MGRGREFVPKTKQVRNNLKVQEVQVFGNIGDGQ